MNKKLVLALIIVFIIGAIVTYFLAKKHNNKKLLIPTYVCIGLTLVGLIYIILDLIIVGGI